MEKKLWVMRLEIHYFHTKCRIWLIRLEGCEKGRLWPENLQEKVVKGNLDRPSSSWWKDEEHI